MRGSEKQVAYAQDILEAIEAAEQPSYENSNRPRGQVSLDRKIVAQDQDAVKLIRAADDGATAGELQKKMENLDDDQSADIFMLCVAEEDKGGLDADDTLTVDAGNVIDALKARFHALYSDKGRLA